MLLFYTYLQAAQEANLHQARQAAQAIVAAHQKLIIFTDKEEKPILVLPEGAEHIFNLISALVETPEEDLSKPLAETLGLPPKAQGWAIPLEGENRPDFHKILPYSKNLKALFTNLREAQKEQNKEKFFGILSQFLKEGRKDEGQNIPWSFEERIQFFELFQFKEPNLDHWTSNNGASFDKTAEQLFVFKLSETTDEELLALQRSHLDGIRLVSKDLEELENRMKKSDSENLGIDLRRFLQPIIRIEKRGIRSRFDFKKEALVELNEFLDQYTVEEDLNTGEKTQKVAVEIADVFRETLPLLYDMIHSKKIRSLNIISISLEKVKELWDFLKKEAHNNNKSLKNLTLEIYSLNARDSLDDNGLIELNNLLKEFSPEMVMLGIGGKFTSTGFKIIKEMLQSEKINSLNLSNNTIGSQGIMDLSNILKHNTTLVDLDLANNEISNEDTIVLADTLKSNKTLTSLRLYNNKITETGAQNLAAALEVNTALKNLNLMSNQIQNEGAIALGNALKVNKTLASLDLCRTQVGERGIGALAEGLSHNSTLTSLNLSSNQIEAVGAQKLAKALEHNQTITSLHLEWNKMGDAGIIALSEAIKVNTNITNLYLKDNKIGDKGAKALAEALEANSAITWLELENNNIGDAGAIDLAESLKSNTTIKVLVLSKNKIKAAGAEALADTFKDKIHARVELQDNEIPEDTQKTLRQLPGEVIFSQEDMSNLIMKAFRRAAGAEEELS